MKDEIMGHLNLEVKVFLRDNNMTFTIWQNFLVIKPSIAAIRSKEMQDQARKQALQQARQEAIQHERQQSSATTSSNSSSSIEILERDQNEI